MPNAKLLATLSLALIAAACAGPYDRQASVPSYNSRAPSLSERTCLDYGLAAGSDSYNRCVQHELQTLQAGRVNRDYGEGRLVADARGACDDYGLDRGTQRYDNCVTREVDARRYRDQGEMSAPPQIYVPDYAPARSPAPYVSAPAPTTGTETFRDEFGFRYDGYGNRIDRFGQVISPQSTRP